LSEHDDVIENANTVLILYLCDMHNNMHNTQSLYSPKFANKLDPCSICCNRRIIGAKPHSNVVRRCYSDM